jgi:two-component system, NtrC family, response regulator AtoC
VKTIRVDVRLIAATNRHLPSEIAAQRFREDLYYRLNVVHVHLPPLRQRKEDIPLLIEHFLRRFNTRLKKSVTSVEPQALEVLTAHEWRGNIRELENAIERCVLFCDGDRIGEGDLPLELRQQGELAKPKLETPRSDESEALAEEWPENLGEEGGLKEAVREATARVERELILRALKQTNNNVTHAARMLKISRKSLQIKMKELGLREENG